MAEPEEIHIDEEGLSRQVTLRYYGTEDAIGIFADQAIVSHSTGLFTLFFFQMQFPPTPTVDELRTLEAIPARCVARIILTPTLMQQFAAAINTNLARYNLVTTQIQQAAGQQKE